MFTPEDQAAIIALVSPLLEDTLTKAVQQAAVATPTTTWRPATVLGTDFAAHTVLVAVDGDTDSITATAIGATPTPGTRAMVIFVPPSAVFALAMTPSAPYAATGSGIAATGIAAGLAAINAVIMPDQGRAGVVVVYAQCRVDQSVASDVYQMAITNCDFVNYEHGPVSPSGGLWIHQVTGYAAMVAGASKTFTVNVNRDSGSGTAVTYAAATAPNFAVATFYPS